MNPGDIGTWPGLAGDKFGVAGENFGLVHVSPGTHDAHLELRDSTRDRWWKAWRTGGRPC